MAAWNIMDVRGRGFGLRVIRVLVNVKAGLSVRSPKQSSKSLRGSGHDCTSSLNRGER